MSPTFFPELIGTPHYATDMARWFRSRGWAVSVITSQPFYPGYERHPGYGRSRRRDVLDDDIQILRLPTIVPKKGRRSWRVLNELNFAIQGIARGPFRRTDAVISVSPGVPWAALVGRSARKRGGQHLTIVHDIQSGIAESLGLAGGLSRAMERSESWSLSRADVVTVLTDEMAKVLRELDVSSPIEVTPLWATVPEPTAEELENSPAAVQYSGNFGSKHHTEVLLDIARELDARDPQIGMVLRGAGHRFDELRDRAVAADVQNVSFVPPVAEADLPAALASTPIHIVTQARGTGQYAMPSKVVNALASGCFVLTMAEEGSALSAMAQRTEGLEWFAIDDSRGVAERIVQLLGDGQLLRHRTAIAREAAATFSRDLHLAPLERMVRLGIAGPSP